MIRVIENEPGDLETIRTLFREYQDFIDVSLCFQSFDDELASLPGKYSADKDGCLYLAEFEGQASGCVAYYRIDETTCELKRLFVRPSFHKQGIGKALMNRAIEDAARTGYQTMILDTLRRLESAGRLYQRLGFSEIEPYKGSKLGLLRFPPTSQLCPSSIQKLSSPKRSASHAPSESENDAKSRRANGLASRMRLILTCRWTTGWLRLNSTAISRWLGRPLFNRCFHTSAAIKAS